MDDLGRGWEHQRAGRYSDADACYRRFLAGHPEHAEAWAALGVVAFKRQNLDEAIDCYKRSLALKPGSAQVLTNLGVAYALKRDFAAAERSFRQAIAIQPASLEAYRNLGHALRDQSQFAEAIPVYQQARMLNPNDIDILGSLGSAFLQSEPSGRGHRAAGHGGQARAAGCSSAPTSRHRTGGGRAVRRGRSRVSARL